MLLNYELSFKYSSKKEILCQVAHYLWRNLLKEALCSGSISLIIMLFLGLLIFTF
ncbi:hypothetical protein J437_LFUL015675 [Ladona fulva]|uniref:Uncharacterized protein n=1 Tax=Ladona fulva TaxID=123851 RepID=A0A8K0P6L3_LADFU|nr:hypothetical protein J437_LFUL015675 [Ladona fulva]